MTASSTSRHPSRDPLRRRHRACGRARAWRLVDLIACASVPLGARSMKSSSFASRRRDAREATRRWRLRVVAPPRASVFASPPRASSPCNRTKARHRTVTQPPFASAAAPPRLLPKRVFCRRATTTRDEKTREDARIKINHSLERSRVPRASTRS